MGAEMNARFLPNPKYQIKLYLWILVIFLFFIFPWILMGLIPELGWVYVVVFLIANALWLIPAVIIVPLYYRSISYELGEEEVIVHKGIITKTVQVVPYRTVTNIDIKRGVFDRLLGLGSIVIHTAGYSQQMSGEAQLVGLADYERAHTNLFAALRRYRRRTGPAVGVEEGAADEEGTQILREIRDELRELRRTLETPRQG